MLLNDFYKYTTQDKTEALLVVDITLNNDHEIYQGHFPEVPVTPGVCQVQMVKEILSHELGNKYQLQSARDIKFINMINPNVVSRLKLEVKLAKGEDGELKARGLMKSDGTKYLKFSMVFN